MYKASNSGSAIGKKGVRYSWNAGDEIDAPEGALNHVGGLKWINSKPEKKEEGIPEEILGKLAEAGFESAEKIAEATDEELLAINGIGPATLKIIREH